MKVCLLCYRVNDDGATECTECGSYNCFTDLVFYNDKGRYEEVKDGKESNETESG